MTRYAKTMSQAVAEVQVRELKMNDPKLMKVFDKLKPRDTVKIKHSSTLERGKDFIEYTVRAKNTLRNGVEKITLARKDSPTSVKRFLYKRDNKVTFAVGDMAASIDDIKEEIIDEIVVEEVEVDEAKSQGMFIVLEKGSKNKVIGQFKDKKKAIDMMKKNAGSKVIQIGKFATLDDKPVDIKVGDELSYTRVKLSKKIKEEVEVDEQFDFVLLDKDNKIVGRYSGKNAKKEAESSKKSAHLPPMRIPKNEVGKMKIVPISPKDKKGIGDMVLAIGEEVEVDEAKSQGMFIVLEKGSKNKVIGQFKDKKKAIDMMKKNAGSKVIQIGKFATLDDKPVDIKVGDELSYTRVKLSKKIKEEVELDEKYDLYHKTFSDAMQHAYDYAKKKLGITVDPKEIDDKVATGPKKPSEGKTNKYRLKGKGGNLQIQVYNKGGSKPFELNMYKEDLDKEDEPVVKKVVSMLKKASQAHAGQAKDLEKAVKEGKMRVYRVSSRKLQGNIHAKDEKEAEKIARSKGMKGKLTITDRGEYRGQPRLTMGEGTWKYPENRSEIDALKKLMARPIRLGREGEGAVVAMQGLLGDDELFDDFYLDGKKNENGDARKTIIKWFRNRVKKDTYGLGDETRELGKKIGLKMSFVPEENNMTEKLTDGNLSLKETVLKMWQEAKSPEQQAAIAIAKKEKEKKEEPDEGNKFSGELDKARKAGKKTFKVGDKEYKVEPKKEEFSWPEWERYLETKKGSLRESILNIWSEELDEGKMKQFHMMVDDGKTAEEIAKAMKLDLKTVKALMPKKENKNLTKEQENGKKKMTDTGKEMTPVDLAPKMPKIKNEKNRL